MNWQEKAISVGPSGRRENDTQDRSASPPGAGSPGRMTLRIPYQHCATIDVADLQMAHLRIAHARRVQHHQHRPVGEGVCRGNQPLDLLHGEHGRESTRRLRIGRLFDEVAPPQNLVEEESDGAHVQLHRARGQVSLTQQVGLVRAQVRLIEAIG